MADNLPDNLSDVEDEYIVGEDSRAMQLTHYVLAERLLQVEYAEIMRQHREEKDSQSLIYILEGGFRGFHKMTAGELWSCLLYTSPSPRDSCASRMPSSA